MKSKLCRLILRNFQFSQNRGSTSTSLTIFKPFKISFEYLKGCGQLQIFLSSPDFRMAVKTPDATLAHTLRSMLTSNFMVYPNPVGTELEKFPRDFIENEQVLFILKSSVGETSLKFEVS